MIIVIILYAIIKKSTKYYFSYDFLLYKDIIQYFQTKCYQTVINMGHYYKYDIWLYIRFSGACFRGDFRGKRVLLLTGSPTSFPWSPYICCRTNTILWFGSNWQIPSPVDNGQSHMPNRLMLCSKQCV